MSDMNPSLNQRLNQVQTLDWRRLLTAAERAAMLQDMASVSLAAGAGLFPEQPWSSFGVLPEASAAPKSPVEQLGFVEHLLPQLSQALSQIARSPVTRAAACTRLVRPELARRVTAAAWMAHARQSRHPPPLSETVTLISMDTPENRAVKSFWNVLRRDCAAIMLLAEAEGEEEAADRARACARRLDTVAGDAWWKEVSLKTSAWTLPPTRRGSLRPDYSTIFRMAGQYRRGFCFEWNHPLLLLPPRETWQLYETWCYFSVFHALRTLGWEPVTTQEVFAVRSGRLALTLAVGQRSEIVLRSSEGRALTLTYNQTFAEGRGSLTHTMRPDITLSDGGRLWILDAKFKPYSEPGEEGEDINQMHAYRDAIVGRDGTTGCQVACAWCLYAGLTGTNNRAQMTYGRGMGTPIGALCLRPGCAETSSRLCEMLQRWLI